MPVSIPTATFSPLTAAVSPDDVAPPAQYEELREVRRFLGAITQARLEWLNKRAMPTDDKCLRFWFNGTHKSMMFYAIMAHFMRGEWPYRQDIRLAAPHVSDSNFRRTLEEAERAKYIVIETAGEDHRRKIVKPTRQTIIAYERAQLDYFKTTAGQLLQGSPVRLGLEYLNQISESLETIRSAQATK